MKEKNDQIGPYIAFDLFYDNWMPVKNLDEAEKFLQEETDFCTRLRGVEKIAGVSMIKSYANRKKNGDIFWDTQPMPFFRALEYIVAGKKVRRPFWDKDDYLVCVQRTRPVLIRASDFFSGDYVLSQEEIFSNDWVLFEGKNNTKQRSAMDETTNKKYEFLKQIKEHKE